METYLLFFVLIAALLGYVIFLHIQLTKKNLFIDSTLKRLSGIEKSWSNEEIVSFLQQIRKATYYKALFRDRLFEEKPLNFLLENEKDSRIFMHYTKEEEIAKKILKDGFLFTDSFYKTAMPVSHDRLDLLMKHNSRKTFGNFLVIICIGNKIGDRYMSEINRNNLKGISIENILTETPPVKNDNSDLVYLLPGKFVKGFINHHSGEITRNPDHDANYDSTCFMKNLESFMAKQFN